MQIYQDIWINGMVQTKGVRDCASRYEPIRAHCRKYDRPITVLDIGANLGYYSFRLSSEFDCTSVMIEGAEGYQEKLLSLARQQKCRDRLILLGARADLGVLHELGRCEHFDVVLALRVVHHFEEPFADVIDAIVSLGDFVFFELPTAGEDRVRARARVREELADHSSVLARYEHDKVGEFPVHVGTTMSPMYLVENRRKKAIVRPFYGSPRCVQHSVESAFDSKRLVKADPLKRGELVTEWVPGINLYTYHTLNGLFPDRRTIAGLIRKCPLPEDSPLTDIRPWNFVLSGAKIALIDHTSETSCSGKPFVDMDPRNCLTNTALYLLAGDLPLEGLPYKQSPAVTKAQLSSRAEAAGIADSPQKGKRAPRRRGMGTRLRKAFDRALRWLTPRGQAPALTGAEALRKTERWQQLKQAYQGQRAFLIGNGPSLNRTPLHLLRDEHTLCFNRFYLYRERVPWTPRMYMCVDERVAKDIAPEIAGLLPQVVHAFLPDIHPSGVDFRAFVPDAPNVEWLSLEWDGFFLNLPRCGLGGTVANVGLQVLCYLGFSPIYLVGVDMDYKDHPTAIKQDQREWTSTRDDDPNHFDPRYFGKGRRYHYPRLHENMLPSMEEASRMAQECGVSIVNAGIGGKLECFPRCTFRSLFAHSEKDELELFLEALPNGAPRQAVRRAMTHGPVRQKVDEIDWQAACQVVDLDVAVGLIPKAIFTHIPYGPWGQKYLLLKRQEPPSVPNDASA